MIHKDTGESGLTTEGLEGRGAATQRGSDKHVHGHHGADTNEKSNGQRRSVLQQKHEEARKEGRKESKQEKS